VARPTISALAVAALAMTAIAIANLVAILPARVAARIDSARTLRADGLPGPANLRPR
jgi:ABC-type lipoprotein release transport system permease subunit